MTDSISIGHHKLSHNTTTASKQHQNAQSDSIDRKVRVFNKIMFSKLHLHNLSRVFERRDPLVACNDVQNGTGEPIDDTKVLESLDIGDGFTEIGVRPMSYAEACASLQPVMNTRYVCTEPFSNVDEEAWAVREVQRYIEAESRARPQVSDYVSANLDDDYAPMQEECICTHHRKRRNSNNNNNKSTRRRG